MHPGPRRGRHVVGREPAARDTGDRLVTAWVATGRERPVERDDTQLVEAARGGEPDAFGPLALRWFDRCFDVAWRILRDRELAADVAQDTLLTAWRQLDRLERPEAFGGWVLRISRNRALDRLRRERRAVPIDDADHLDPDRSQRPLADPELELADREGAELVWAAAAALGERDTSLLDLHLRHGCTPAELADELGLAPNAAHQALFRLRDRLGVAVRSWLLWQHGEPACVVLRGELAAVGVERFDAATSRAIARHVEDCLSCAEERDRVTAPAALFAAVPLAVAPLLLRDQAMAALASAGVPVGGARAASAADGSVGDGGAGDGGAGDGGVGDGGADGGASEGARGSSGAATGRARTRALTAGAVVALVLGGIVTVVAAGGGADEPVAIAPVADAEVVDADLDDAPADAPPVVAGPLEPLGGGFGDLPAASADTSPSDLGAGGGDAADAADAPSASATPEVRDGDAPADTSPPPRGRDVAPSEPPTTSPPAPAPPDPPPAPAPPTVDGFEAASGSVCPPATPGGTPDGQHTLTWATTGADTVTITIGGGAPATVAADGQQEVCVPSGTIAVLTATNAGGSDARQLTLTGP
ncbi:sigma-70 family RNA polymerase sigma factor [Nitriliruptoraceae bacterium ZYF776]|nr:sigma-70 family RNA polymerase sigma factor [Profundirhabdus halotolerans]